MAYLGTAPGCHQRRVVINTLLAIAASAVMALATSRLLGSVRGGRYALDSGM